MNEQEHRPDDSFDQPDDSFHQKVCDRAYALWEQEGRPEGRDTEFWLTAEQECRQEAEGAGRSPGHPKADPGLQQAAPSDAPTRI